MWLPHDAVAKTLATKKSTIEQFTEWVDGRWRIEKVPRLSVQHGIDATRSVLKQVQIDIQRCSKGINALIQYKQKYNDVLKAYSDTPQHDWASNGADAFRYLSLVVVDDIMQEATPDAITELGAPEPYTLEDLWEDNENDNWRSGIIRI